MTTAEAAASASFQGERHTRRRSRLFVGLTIVLAIVAILGFSPRHFWPLLTYGVLLVVLDYSVGMAIEGHRVAPGETVDRVLPMTFFIVRDLVMFAGFLVAGFLVAGFLVAGVIQRRKPAVHRALMFLATYSLVLVGLGRFLGMIAPYAHMSVLVAIFFAPILVAAAYDWHKRGRPHPLYAAGFVIYLLFRSPAQAIWFPVLRDHWPPIGRALLQPFL